MTELLTSIVAQAIGFGMVWLYAWICNPNIDSGTVCLLGLIYGGICAATAGAERRIKATR